MAMPTITENQVIDAVISYFEKNGIKVISKCTGYQRGIDIVATNKNNIEICVEAKGGKPNDSKKTHTFSSTQVLVHVSRAVYTALTFINANEEIIPCIALPNNDDHKLAIGKVGNILADNNIRVLWVSEENFEVTSTLPL
jgi:hypothetical protein